MTIRESIRASLALLSRADRRRFFLATGLQTATSLLDLFGVLLIGLVGVLAAASVQHTAPPPQIENIAAAFGLGQLSTEGLAAAVGLIAAVLLLIKSGLAILIMRRILRFLANRSAAISTRLAATLLSRPLLEAQARPSQQVAYALGSSVNFAITVVLSSAGTIVAEGALLLLLGTALLLIDPVVTVVTIAYFALIVALLQRLLGDWAARAGQAGANADVASTTTIQEALLSYREVSVSDRRGFFRDRFSEFRNRSARANADNQLIGMLPKYLMEAALVFGATLLAVSQFLTSDPISAIATLALFLAAGTRVMPSLVRMQTAATGLRAASGGAEMAYELAEQLKHFAVPERPSLAASVIRDRIDRGNPDFVPTLEIVGVTLTYPDAETAALRDVSCRVAAGESLALVGATGAGKSSLTDVILGVIDPDVGSVAISGLPPADAVIKWPGGIGYVPQEVALSNGSVRENIALGLPREAIDDERVWEALERSHIADFLRSSREGLDTLIGERGVRLSGGQRQRLGIARALYTRPQLLVLDEATSSLDAETEHAIASTFKALEGDVTTVTVAHRLATIRHADLVLYLEHGHVLARGSFEEVRSAVPHFERQAKLLGL